MGTCAENGHLLYIIVLLQKVDAAKKVGKEYVHGLWSNVQIIMTHIHRLSW